jgi:hypothetical protein
MSSLSSKHWRGCPGPLRPLYTFRTLSHESPTRPLGLGGAATRPSASWPMLRRRRSLHRPLNIRQPLRRIPVRPGDFCQQTTPAQSSSPSCCSSRACPEGCSRRLVVKLVVHAGAPGLVSARNRKTIPARDVFDGLDREAMPLSWAPPASLHFFGLFSYESPTRPLRLGGAATSPSASWPMLHRRRSLHRPVKNGSASGISRYVLGVSASKQHRHGLLPPAAAPVGHILRAALAASSLRSSSVLALPTSSPLRRKNRSHLRHLC